MTARLLLLALAIATPACSSPCARWTRIVRECTSGLVGDADTERCEERLERCSDADVARIHAHLDCVEERAQCDDGAAENEDAAEQCFGHLAGLSTGCVFP